MNKYTNKERAVLEQVLELEAKKPELQQVKKSQGVSNWEDFAGDIPFDEFLQADTFERLRIYVESLGGTLNITVDTDDKKIDL